MEELSIIDRTQISSEEEQKAVYGDYRQAENLLAQKMKHQKKQ